MARVQLLDNALINQIAAGEVVERPANVVKELVENSVDAGATEITVEIVDGGKERILIIDNGHGMTREDAQLAVRRHATSKIRSFDDLVAIQTLGFRGEALPSIASVSRFTLTTRTEDAVAGVRLEIEGGAAPVVSEVGCPRGTTIDVRDIFYNVPARRKFLKARQTEMSHITDVCVRTAVSQPALRMTLIHNDRRVRSLAGGGGLLSRAKEIFDEPLQELKGTRDGVEVHAVLGAPGKRSSVRTLYLVVNGRAVTDRVFARHIAFAFGPTLEKNKYPIGIVHVNVDPSRVDVNAHPQKTEVRFAPGVLDQVTKIIGAHFGGEGPAARDVGFWESRLQGRPREVPLPTAPIASPGAVTDWGDAFAGSSLQSTSPQSPQSASPSTSPPQSPSPSRPPSPASSVPSTPSPAGNADHAGEPGARRGVAERVEPYTVGPRARSAASAGQTTGVVGETRGLWIVSHEDSLCIVDPVAIHAHQAFRAVTDAFANGEVPRKRRVFPDRVEVSIEDAALIGDAADDLLPLGLVMTVVGETTVAVHEVPRALSEVESARFVTGALASLRAADFGEGAAKVFRELAALVPSPVESFVASDAFAAPIRGLPPVLLHRVSYSSLGR